MKRTVLLALAAVLVPLSGWAASFDCRKAVSAVEKMICADRRLSRMDDELALSFRAALTKVRDKSGLRQEQRAWLERRDSDCLKVGVKGDRTTDTDCLWFAYQVRTARLQAMLMGGSAKAQGAPDVHFPPYPDVSGYELPYPRPGVLGRISRLRRIESGDIEILYVLRYGASSSEHPFGPPGSIVLGRLQFFSGIGRRLSQEEASSRDPRRLSGDIQYGGQARIVYPDGSVVSAEDQTDAVCYENFERHLQRSDASGRVLARKSIVYLLDEATIREDSSKPTCDEGAGMKVWERTRTDRLVVVPLEDGSFLAHSPGANYIIRFDRHLNTRYTNGKRVFVVDTETIDRIKQESSQDLPYFRRAQEINDKVNQLILERVK